MLSALPWDGYPFQETPQSHLASSIRRETLKRDGWLSDNVSKRVQETEKVLSVFKARLAVMVVCELCAFGSVRTCKKIKQFRQDVFCDPGRTVVAFDGSSRAAQASNGSSQ